MARLYKIDDEFHADLLAGDYASFEAALAEIHRVAALPWDSEPNQAPCINWRNCGRLYQIVEYETSGPYWVEIREVPVMGISHEGVVWKEGFGPPG
mgnify:CR=1 FL=1|jgi:hypothetical protein